MSRQRKLILRVLARPSDFTFDELTTLLGHFGYLPVSIGKTSGACVAFANDGNDYIRLHRPHPGAILKRYQIDEVIGALSERGLL
jgi:hypothetical protein